MLGPMHSKRKRHFDEKFLEKLYRVKEAKRVVFQEKKFLFALENIRLKAVISELLIFKAPNF